MKKLYLVRHAKSSWKNSGQRDFDRPLNKRGCNDAQEMGRRLNRSGEQPDLIVSSEANRAITTAEKLKSEFQNDPELRTDARLYHSSAATILNVINETSDRINTLCIVCHNPGISELNYLLTGNPIQMVTAAVATIGLEINEWKEAFSDCGILLVYDYPKSINE